MNKIFRVIWNQSTQSWTAASELAKGHTKSASTSGETSAMPSEKTLKIGMIAATLAAAAAATPAFAAETIEGAGGVAKVHIQTEDSNHNTRNNILIGKNATHGQASMYDQLTESWAFGSGVRNKLSPDMRGTNNIVIGNGTASGDSGIVLGDGARTWALAGAGNHQIAIGSKSLSSGNYTVAIGMNSQSGAEGAVALGGNAIAVRSNSLALGAGAVAQQTNATAIGHGANATRGDSVAIGSLSNTVEAATREGNINVDGVVYDRATGEISDVSRLVSFGSAGKERQLKHVAPGKISADSTDAINGSQLFQITKNIQNRPITFNGTTGSTTRKLGETLQITGSGSTGGTYSSKNIKTEATAGKIEIKLADSPTFSSIETTGGAKIKGSAEITGTLNANGGLAVATTQTVNMGGNRVQNVANGTNSNDAVNVSQLNLVRANTIQLEGNSGSTASQRFDKSGGLSFGVKGTGMITSSASGTDVTFDLTTDAKNKINNAANQSLSNINSDGINKIKQHAKEAINVVGGDNTTVTPSDQNGVKTFTVNTDLSGYTRTDALDRTAKIRYKANNAASHQATLDTGLTFKNGDGLAITAEAGGVVNFALNDDTKTKLKIRETVKAGNGVTVSNGTNGTGGQEFTVAVDDTHIKNKAKEAIEVKGEGLAQVTPSSSGDKQIYTVKVDTQGVKNLAKNAVNITSNDITVTSDANNDTKTFTLALQKSTAVTAGDNKVVTSGAVHTAIDTLGSNTIKLSGDNNTNTDTQALKKSGGLAFGVKGQAGYIETTAAGSDVTLKLNDNIKTKLDNLANNANDTYANRSLSNINAEGIKKIQDQVAIVNGTNTIATTEMVNNVKTFKVDVDTTKTVLAYKAENETAKNTKLSDGLTFKNTEGLTIATDANGVVNFGLNEDTKAKLKVRETVEAGEGVTVTNGTNDTTGQKFTVSVKNDHIKRQAKQAVNVTSDTPTDLDVVKDSGDLLDTYKLSLKKSTAVAANDNKVVTSHAVHEAIKASGWKLKANDDTGDGEKIANDGDVFFNQGKNITVTRTGNKIEVKTKDDVSFANITASTLTTTGAANIGGMLTAKNGFTVEAGGVNIANGNTIQMGNNVVQGVAAGTNNTDAVNVSQLNALRTDSQTYFHVKSSKTQNFGNPNATAQATGENAVAAGPNATAAGVSSVALGDDVKAAADKAVAIGSAALAENEKSVAIGDQAKAKHNNSIALGAGSETGDIGNDQRYVIKNDEGENAAMPQFAGVAKADYGSVSVGKANAERQIHHVAAGRISATSTDAVNGSQLYYIANNTGFNIQENGGAKSRINNNGEVNFANGTFSTAAVSDGNNTAKVQFNVVTQNIDSNETTGVASVNGTTPGLTTAETVVNAINKAVEKSGWTVKANSETDGKRINNNGEVNFVEGKNINITRDANKIIVKTIDDVSFTTVNTSSNVNIGGVANVTGMLNANGGLTVAAEKTVNMGGNLVEGVKAGEKDTDAVNLSQLNATTKALTEKGLNFSGNSGSTHRDLGSTLSVFGSGSEEDEFSSQNVRTEATERGIEVKFSENPVFKNVTARDVSARNLSTSGTITANGKITAKNGVQITAGGLTVNNGQDVKMGYNKIQQVSDGVDGNDAVNLNQLRNFTNASGWTVKANGDEGKRINNNGTVDFRNGSNIEISRDANKITVKTVANPTFSDGATIGGMLNANGGLKVGSGTSVNMGGNLVENVKAGEKDSDAVNLSQLNATNTNVSNLKNEIDTINEGWQIAGDDRNQVAAIKSGKKVNFVNGTHTVSTVSEDAFGADVKFDVKTENLTANGNTGRINGADDETALVTAGNVADMINNAGWIATAGATAEGKLVGSASDELVKPNDNRVVFKAGKNLKVEQKGKEFIYSTQDDVSFNNVTAGNVTASDRIAINNGPALTTRGIDAANKKITKVANGTAATDAVNLSQLNATKDSLTNAGLSFSGNQGSTSRKLGETLNISGAASSAGGYSSKNVKTVVTAGKVEIQIADNPTFADVKANTLTATGDVNVGGNANVTGMLNAKGGLTVAPNRAIDMGGNVLNKVGAGVADTDAVNVSQLKGLGNNTVKLRGDSGSTDTQNLNKQGGLSFGIKGDSGYIETAGADSDVNIRLSDGVKRKLDNLAANPNAVYANQSLSNINDEGKRAIYSLVAMENGNNTIATTEVVNHVKTFKVDVDTSKTKLAYRAETESPKQTSLSDGLTFKNSDGLTIASDAGGVVNFGLNAETKRQLAIRETVVAGNGVTVSESDNDSGGKAFTVAVKDDHIKAKAKEAVEVKASGLASVSKTEANGKDVYTVNVSDENIKGAAKNAVNVTGDNDIAVTPSENDTSKTFALKLNKDDAVNENSNKAVTSGAVFNAIKASGWTLKANEETSGEKIANNGEVVFKQGDNILISRDKNAITVKTVASPTFDNITAKTGLTVNNGATVNMGGNVVKGVANGTADTDAVNVSQLNAVRNNTVKLTGNSGTTNGQALNKDGGLSFGVKGDETYILSEASDSNVVVKLSDAAKNKLDNAADKDLSNLNPAGTNVIKNAAKDAIAMIDGENTKVTTTTPDGVKTFKVDVDLSAYTKTTDLNNTARLSYKAGGDTAAKNTSLSDGLTFANTNGLTIASKEGGVVEFGLSNETVKAIAVRETVVAGNGVTVSESDNATGGKAFTVAVKDDHIKAKAKEAVDVVSGSKDDIVVDKTPTDTKDTYTITLNKATEVTEGDNKAVTSDAVYKAVNKAVNDSGWTLKANEETNGEKIANNGEVVFKQGDNILISRDKNAITVKTVASPTFDNITAKTGLTVNKGATVNMGGNVVKGVANGTADTDAVNVSQLKGLGNNTVKLTGNNGTTNGQALNKDGGLSFGIKGDNDYIVSKAEGSDVVVKLSDAAKNKLDNAADKNLSNVTPAGKTVIQNAAKEAVEVKATGLATLKKTQDGNKDVYTVNVSDDSIKGVAKDAVNVTGDDDITVSTNQTATSKTFALKLNKDDVVTENSNKAVTSGAVYNAINNSGWTLKANNDTTGQKIANNGEVVFKQGSNIEISRNNNEITVKTVASPTFDNITAKTGLTVNKGATVNMGGNRVQNVADATEDGDAVNLKQLNAISQGLTDKGLNFTGNSGNTARKLGETLNITGSATTVGDYSSANVKTVVSDGKVEIQISENPSFVSVNAKDVIATNVSASNGTFDNITAKTGLTVNKGATVNMGGNRVQGVADATQDGDAVNFKQFKGLGNNTVKLTGNSGTTGTQALNKDGGLSFGIKGDNDYIVSKAEGSDVVVKLSDEAKNKLDNAADKNLSNLTPEGTKAIKAAAKDAVAVVSENENDISISKSPTTEKDIYSLTLNKATEVKKGDQKVVTSDAVYKAVNNAGWTLKANEETSGEKIANNGEVVFKQGSNIEISRSNNEITVKTVASPTFETVSTTGDVHIGGDANVSGMIHANGGLTVAPQQSINMGGNRVQNVGNAVHAGDAVNYGQFKAELGEVDGRLRSGIAGAIATSTLVQAMNPGESIMAVGGGTYRGASAFAIGYSKVSDNGRVIIKVVGSGNNSGDYSGGASVGFKF